MILLGTFFGASCTYLLIVLRLCWKHDQILSAAHAVAAVVEAFFPSHTQGVVDALVFYAFGGAVSFTIERHQCHYCCIKANNSLSTLVTSKSPPSSKSIPSQKSLQRSKEHGSSVVWFLKKSNLMVLVFIAMSQSNYCYSSLIQIQVEFMHWWWWFACFRSTAIWRWSWWKHEKWIRAWRHISISQLELPRKILRENTGVWWPKKILRSFFASREAFACPPWIRVPSAVAHPHIVACVRQKESQRFFRGSWYFQSSEYSGL